MKRFATFSFLVLAISFLLPAAAHAQLEWKYTLNSRDAFIATNVQEDEVYNVSATVNGSPLAVYGSASSPNPTTVITAWDPGDDGYGVALRLYINPPSAGGTVVLTATLQGVGTVISGSKYYDPPTVSKTPTTISISATPLSQVYGAVILTANVSGNPTGTPNGGTITFIDGGSPLTPSISVSSGVAILHAEGLLVGDHTISPVYSGDDNFEASTSGSITITVNRADLTVIGVTAENKIYDGGISATLHTLGATLQGVVVGDAITPDFNGATGTFADKNKGDGKTVTVAGITISGTSIGNYTLIQPTPIANITPKELTITGITASNKEYDANTNATLDFGAATFNGMVGTDVVTLNASGASGVFTDKTVGTGKTVTVSGLTLDGAAAANYALMQPTATANIAAKNLTVSGITANDKVYNGTTTATLNTTSATLAGVISLDIVTLNTSGATGTFSDKEVGTNKTVTISGLTIDGADAGNYTLTQPTATASIITSPAPPELLVRFDVQKKDIVVLELGTLAPPVQPQLVAPGKKQKNQEERTYRFPATPASPWIEIIVAVKNEGHSGQAEILSIAYSNTTTITHPDNALKVEWATDKLDALKELQQKVELKPALQVEAKYDSKKDITKINIHQDGQKKDKELTSPGVALIGMATYNGALQYNGPVSETTVGSPSLAGRDAQVAVEQMSEDLVLPTAYALHNAYPNPFNPSTTIRFDLPQAAKVRLAVYDMLGREVALLADEERPAGQHSVRFDAGKLSSGMYIFRLQAGSFTQTKKLMLMK